MIYLVVMKDKINKKCFYLGYSTIPQIAERYLEMRKEKYHKTKCRGDKFSFKVIPMPFEEFMEKQKANSDYGSCSELIEVTDNIFLSEDDLELVTSGIEDRLNSGVVWIDELTKTLKLIDSNDARKTIKLLKKLKRSFDIDCSCEDVWEQIDWDYAIKNVIL